MKVTRKALKGGDESFCFVGFPVTSLPKYSPDSAETRYTGEKEVDILLPGQGLRREYAGVLDRIVQRPGNGCP